MLPVYNANVEENDYLPSFMAFVNLLQRQIWVPKLQKGSMMLTYDISQNEGIDSTLNCLYWWGSACQTTPQKCLDWKHWLRVFQDSCIS